MTQEEKQLLLKDLCARLPYGVIVLDEPANDFGKLFSMDSDSSIHYFSESIEELRWQTIYNIKTYLRPMSGMTEEEDTEFDKILDFQMEYVSDVDFGDKIELFDWLNEHHFDYRGLIKKGLALEAPEGMYKQ